MQTWKRDSHGKRVLTPEAIRAHLGALVDMRFTRTEAFTVLKPWCIPHELTAALEELDETKSHIIY
jgi:hypothetical protein